MYWHFMVKIKCFLAPPISYFTSTSVDSPEWQHCLSLPSVSYVLRMLAGLCKQHAETQVAAISAVEKVHLLEQVSTEKHLGTLAENVLETMMENAECQREVCVAVRSLVGELVCVAVCRSRRFVRPLERRRNARPWL